MNADRAESGRRRFFAGAAVVGLAGGAIGGLFGIGGGAIMVPLITLLLGRGQHGAHAASVAAIVPIAIAGALVFGEADQINLTAAVLILVTSLPAARLGARWMRQVPEWNLQQGFGLLLLAMAILMFFR